MQVTGQASSDFDRRVYLAEEHYSTLRRRWIGIILAIPPITVLALIYLGADIGWPLSWRAWLGVLVGEIILLTGLYFAGRALLRHLIERRYDLDIAWGEDATTVQGQDIVK